jgi:hypothetical protein
VPASTQLNDAGSPEPLDRSLERSGFRRRRKIKTKDKADVTLGAVETLDLMYEHFCKDARITGKIKLFSKIQEEGTLMTLQQYLLFVSTVINKHIKVPKNKALEIFKKAKTNTGKDLAKKDFD